MPIYEYECIDQKHRFEIIQKFSDPPVSHCTVCGGLVQRVVSAPAIQFKGSGWYITDYARKGSADSGGSSTKSTPVSESKSSSSDKPASSESSSSSSTSSTTDTKS